MIRNALLSGMAGLLSLTLMALISLPNPLVAFALGIAAGLEERCGRAALAGPLRETEALFRAGGEPVRLARLMIRRTRPAQFRSLVIGWAKNRWGWW